MYLKPRHVWLLEQLVAGDACGTPVSSCPIDFLTEASWDSYLVQSNVNNRGPSPQNIRAESTWGPHSDRKLPVQLQRECV